MHVLLALVAAAATSPPAPPRAEAAAPPAALDELSAFEGAWTCEGRRVVDREGGRRVPITSRLSIARTLGGYWFSGRAVRDDVAPEPLSVTRLFFWSYDGVLGKFVGGWLDDRGGWSAQTAMPWDEDKLVFLGHVTATGEKVTARETFTRPHDGAFTRRYEILGFIEWGLVEEETCRRTAGDNGGPAS
jgi:hypothetical protein